MSMASPDFSLRFHSDQSAARYEGDKNETDIGDSLWPGE